MTPTAVTTFVRQRALLRELVARSLSETYRGNALSFVWGILHPLATILLYMVVFVTLAKTRLGTPSGVNLDFGAYMLVGLSAWLGIQNGLIVGSNALVANANLVKQVVFPIELLPMRAVLSSLLPEIVGFIAVLLYMLIGFGFLSPLLPLALLVFACQIVMISGMVLLLSPLVAIVRDIQQLVTMIASAGIFLLPIPFPPGTLPAWFEILYWINPIAHIIWMYQDCLFYGAFVHPWSWLIAPVVAIVLFELGVRFFEHMRHHLGDAL